MKIILQVFINNLVFYKNKPRNYFKYIMKFLNNSNVLFYFNSENIIDINGTIKK